MIIEMSGSGENLKSYLQRNRKGYINQAMKINPNHAYCNRVFDECLQGTEFLGAETPYIGAFRGRFFKAIGRGFKAIGKGIKKGIQFIKDKRKAMQDEGGSLQINPEGFSYQSNRGETRVGQLPGGGFEVSTPDSSVRYQNQLPQQSEQSQSQIPMETQPQNKMMLPILIGAGVLAIALISKK